MNLLKNLHGFSLLELIAVLGVIMILGTAVFFWVDPVAQTGKAEDKRRQQDILNIANAFTDYARDHQGVLPILGQVNTNKKVLCTTQSGNLLTCRESTQYCLPIDDAEFFAKYLGKLPLDPDKTSNTDTGYYIVRDANNNVTLGSCNYSVATVTYQPVLRATCDAYGGGACWYKHATEVFNTDCNAVCASNNKTCVANATSITDVACTLSGLLTNYDCSSGCDPVPSNEPPFWADDSTCGYPTTVVSCTQASLGGSSICPCK